MKRKNYIFTNKKHSDKAIMSTILGIISMVSMIIVIYLTYLQEGNATVGYGMTRVFATIFSLTGLGLGLVSLREKETYKLFPWLGTVINVLLLAGIAFLLYLGRMN